MSKIIDIDPTKREFKEWLTEQIEMLKEVGEDVSQTILICLDDEGNSVHCQCFGDKAHMVFHLEICKAALIQQSIVEERELQ